MPCEYSHVSVHWKVELGMGERMGEDSWGEGNYTTQSILNDCVAVISGFETG